MGRSIRRLLCFFMAAVMLGAFSTTALAADHYTVIDSLHFDIALQEDGSAQITEIRDVAFVGDYEFSLYGFGNAFTGPRVFSDWQVTMDGEPLAMLDAPDNEDRPENTFAVEDGDGENTVYIYHRTWNTSRTFEISYRVENAIKLYTDAADFFWNLTSAQDEIGIARLSATVTVPEGIPEEEFRIWAHGPLEGTFEKQDASTAYLLLDTTIVRQLVDLRVTMPPDFFYGGWEQGGEGLADILAKEKELADSANARREEAIQEQAEQDAYWAQREAWEEEHPILASIQNFCQGITDFFYYNIVDQFLGLAAGLGFLVFAVTGLFSRRQSDPKKYRLSPVQAPEYYRNLPDDRPAPAVDRLVHFYKEDGRADISRQISAALLELELKKLVRFQMSGKDTRLLLDDPLGRELFPSRESAPAAPSQTRRFKAVRKGGKVITESSGWTSPEEPAYQETLWNFLLVVADGQGSVSVSGLKDYVKENRELAYRFRSKFDRAVEREHTSLAETKYMSGPRLLERKALWLAPMVGILTVLVCVFSMIYDGIMLSSCLMMGVIAFVVTALLVVLYHMGRKFAGNHCYILEQQAENDLALWQAFGRFLDDFTTFDKKELPEFPVWREYMVYAVAMGKGEKVAKALAVKYPEAFSTAADTFDDDLYRMLRDMEFYEALNSIGREVAEVRPPRTSSSGSGNDSWTDNWSDNSGGGGGFSDSGGGSDSGSSGSFSD